MSTRRGTDGADRTDAEDAAEAVRAEVVVTEPDCPLADESLSTGRIHDVNRSVASSDGGVVEEFVVEGGEPSDEYQELFDLGEGSVYRMKRERGRGCVCEVIEGFDCVVSDVRAENGELRVSFHAPDVGRVKEITDALGESFGGVSLRELARPGEATDEHVFVDASRLTERQREVVRTAYEMGYFEDPKRANATEVADEMDIATSTLIQHLSAAERKIVGGFLGE